jgi:predicted transcriptional regulator
VKVTELSKICNISRMTVYKHINEGLTKDEILERYTRIKLTTDNEYIFLGDLKEVKKIVKKIILEYQESLSKEINFSDIDNIYEIVKKY